MPYLAVILFLPWFMLLGSLYWLFPRQPRTARRKGFDLAVLAVAFVLSFIGHVTEYPVASVLLRETNNMTLAVGARSYLYEQRYLWGDFAAAPSGPGARVALCGRQPNPAHRNRSAP